MPRGYVGNVQYVGFGKYRCPDCGITKVKEKFVSRRKGEERMSMSRCNSCEYKRYAKDYYQRRKSQDPGIRRRLYEKSAQAQKSRSRSATQAALEERIAELGITDDEIKSVTGMSMRRIQNAMRPGSRWSWSFIQEISSVVNTYHDPVLEANWEDRDPELPPIGIVGE